LFQHDRDLLLSSGFTFQEFDGSKITILGGTGFVGQWLVYALTEFGAHVGFTPEITVVTRNTSKAQKLFDEKFGIKVKVSEFDFASGSMELEESDFFINGATPSTKKTGMENAEAVYTSSINASSSIIRSAIKHQNKPRVVNLSSGIVYGSQALSERNQPERPISIQPASPSGYLNAKIAADELYGSKTPMLSLVKRKISGEDRPLIQRFALHARELVFKDLEEQTISIQAEYPNDFGVFLKLLDKYDR
jgi:hypothetical protein